MNFLVNPAFCISTHIANSICILFTFCCVCMLSARFYLGLVRRPHVQSFDGVADSHIPVNAHHCQREGAGEHVVIVDGHYRLAQGVAKRPEAQKHVSALETVPNENNEHVELTSTLKRFHGEFMNQSSGA